MTRGPGRPRGLLPFPRQSSRSSHRVLTCVLSGSTPSSLVDLGTNEGDTVINTRLFRPVVPIGYRNNISRDKFEVLSGLGRRMDDNPGPKGSEGRGELPFLHAGRTYKLPVRYHIFQQARGGGQRAKFATAGHVLMITSNGQVHRNWTKQEFEHKATRVKKPADRILVVVEVDALPIQMRSQLFTADRSQFVQSPEAGRLEQGIASFIADWSELVAANNDLIREQIEGGDTKRSTVGVAQRILGPQGQGELLTRCKRRRVRRWREGPEAETEGKPLRQPDPLPGAPASSGRVGHREGCS